MGRGESGGDAFSFGGQDDLWKLMGMKKFSIMDVSDSAETAPDAEEKPYVKGSGPVAVFIDCVPGSNDSVCLKLRMTVRDT